MKERRCRARDELRIDMAPASRLAYHFIPQRPNNQLVVLHHGHACTFDDDPSPRFGYGMQRTIKALLGEGYGVLVVFMPHMRPVIAPVAHDAMFKCKPRQSDEILPGVNGRQPQLP